MGCETCGCKWEGNCPEPESVAVAPQAPKRVCPVCGGTHYCIDRPEPSSPRAAQELWYVTAYRFIRSAGWDEEFLASKEESYLQWLVKKLESLAALAPTQPPTRKLLQDVEDLLSRWCDSWNCLDRRASMIEDQRKLYHETQPLLEVLSDLLEATQPQPSAGVDVTQLSRCPCLTEIDSDGKFLKHHEAWCKYGGPPFEELARRIAEYTEADILIPYGMNDRMRCFFCNADQGQHKPDCIWQLAQKVSRD